MTATRTRRPRLTAALIHEAYTHHLSNVWTKATMDLLNAGLVGDTPTREALDRTTMRYLADAHEDLDLRNYDNVLTYAAAIESAVAAAIAAHTGRTVKIGNVTYSASTARPALRREVTVETTDTPAPQRVVMSSDDVRITMGHDQAEKIIELMGRHIDLDVVRLDNDDADGAALVVNFIAALSNALEN